MSTAALVGGRWGVGEEGAGYSGVTPAEKDQACGRDPDDLTADHRMATAARNAQDVAEEHGSGYWTAERRERDF